MTALLDGDPARQRDGGVLVGEPGAPAADLEVDEQPERLARGARGVLQLRDVGRVVDAHQQAVGAAVQIGQAGQLGRRHDRREQHHAGDAGVGHHLGLAQRGAADADAAGGDLRARDLDGLVDLGDGADVVAVGGAVRRERRHVGVEDIEVEHQRRRAELVPRAGLADQVLVRAARHIDHGRSLTPPPRRVKACLRPGRRGSKLQVDAGREHGPLGADAALVADALLADDVVLAAGRLVDAGARPRPRRSGRRSCRCRPEPASRRRARPVASTLSRRCTARTRRTSNAHPASRARDCTQGRVYRPLAARPSRSTTARRPRGARAARAGPRGSLPAPGSSRRGRQPSRRPC